MAKVRTDKTEYMRRIFAIQGWIIEGVQSALIIRQILNSEWCQSNRHAERMLKEARDMWTDVPEAELKQRRRLKVSELQQLKRSMKEVYKGTPSGISAVLAVEKEIIMLEGLRSPSKVEIAGKDGKPIATETTHKVIFENYAE